MNTKSTQQQRTDFCRMVLALSEEDYQKVAYYTKGLHNEAQNLKKVELVLSKARRPRIKKQVKAFVQEVRTPVHKRMSLKDFADSMLTSL